MRTSRQLGIGSAVAAGIVALSLATAAEAVVRVPSITTRGAELAHMGGTADGDAPVYPCPGMHDGRQGQMMQRQGTMGGYGMGGDMMRDPGRGGSMMRRPGYGGDMRVVPNAHLSVEDVRHFLEHRLDAEGNPRVKVGDVKARDDHTIVADIVTQDGALVDRFAVDRHSGEMERIE